MPIEVVLSIVAIVMSGGALAVSLLSLRLQQRTREQQRTTDVEVRVAEHVLEELSMPLIAYADDTRPSPPPWLEYVVRVVVHNGGERPEWLRDICIYGAGGQQPGLGEPVREPLPAGVGIERSFTFDTELLTAFADSGFAAVAELGSGQQVRSSTQELDDRLLAELSQNKLDRDNLR